MYAGWSKRVAAGLIDGLVLAVPAGLVYRVLGPASTRTDPVRRVTSYRLSAGLLIWLVLGLVYFVILEGRETGQTIGKRVMGIRLRNAADAGSVGYGKALGRRLIAYLYAYSIVGALPDLLWPLWDARKQTLHDKVVHSVVVDAA